MTVKYTLLAAITLVQTSVIANPAPVTDLNRSKAFSNTTASQGQPAGSLEQRLTTLERIVEARTEAQLRMAQQLQSLLDEVSELRGVTETHTYQLDEILQRQRDLYQEIDRRVSAIQTPAANNSAAVTPVDAQAASGYSTDANENDAYDKAVNMVLKDRRYDAAIPEFESFIKSYPNSSYAPNAHYWLGQLLFNNNELAKAKTHFERVVSNFPQSNKVADALLKLGQVAERENKKDAALRYYRQLVEKHSTATSAKLAQDRINALK
jgi:tol-pal system protein YbgF